VAFLQHAAKIVRRPGPLHQSAGWGGTNIDRPSIDPWTGDYIMKKLLLAGIAGLALLAPANAADLGRQPYKAPPVAAPVAPLPAWTGCYIGANIGGGWTHKHFDDDFGFDDGGHTASGIVGGGQFGCDYQFGLGKAPGFGGGGWVIGFQTMWDGADLSGDHHFQFEDVHGLFHDETFHTHVHWFGTLTARLGFLITPAVLLYGKGGVAWVGEDHSINDDGVVFDSGHITRTGWDAGVGLEWMFVPGWSAFVEYDHLGFGHHDERFDNVCCVPFNEHVRQDIDKVVVGVNWRFGGFGKGKTPVVARY
jgi:outer membrane immunogenic protein